MSTWKSILLAGAMAFAPVPAFAAAQEAPDAEVAAEIAEDAVDDAGEPDEAEMAAQRRARMQREMDEAIAFVEKIFDTSDLPAIEPARLTLAETTTAALVRNGPSYAGQLVDGVTSWLNRRQLTLQQTRGMLAVPVDADAAEYARSGYVSGLERAKRTYAQ